MRDLTPRFSVLPVPLLAILAGCPGGNGGGDSPPPAPPPPPEPIALVSKSSGGFAADTFVQEGAASEDGRYIAFSTDAANLVAGDTNRTSDIFVHDTETGTTTRVSVDSNGIESDGDSFEPSISADGRYVGFVSNGTNLAAGITNGVYDAFVHDTQTGVTTRVSLSAGGDELDDDTFVAVQSADGRFVLFENASAAVVGGDTNMVPDVFVRDLQAATTTRVSVDSSGTEGDGFSADGAISADGRFVAFHSGATNLVAGDTNNEVDIFRHDRQSGETIRVSVATGGAQGDDSSRAPEISADGRFVAWYSEATNLVGGDTNGGEDIFLHDVQTGVTSRVSVASDGSEANDPSDTLAISADGRYVAFYSEATNLVADDTNGEPDTFVRDTMQNLTYRVSVAADGMEANRFSEIVGMSADGRYVLFYSPATNLDPAAVATSNQLFRAPNLAP